MIRQALAAQAEAASLPLWQQEEAWLTVAFVIFLAILARLALKKITAALDARAEAIRADLDEARNLREEAQAALASYQRRQREAVQEAEEILRLAEEQARRITREAEKAVEETLRRRERIAEDKIASARNRAIDSVRAEAVEIAVAATRKLIESGLTEPEARALIDGAITDLPRRLQ